MSKYRIKCPYCFSEFDDDQVCFRAETVFFTEDELDPLGRGRTRDEIRRDERYSKAEIETQLKKFDIRRRYLSYNHDSESNLEYWEFRNGYWNFWNMYGGSNESAEQYFGKECYPYERHVFLPDDTQRITGVDGMVIAAVDDLGEKTYRRVCPKCHNPLPAGYGNTPVKFISIIGESQAGKTVFLSVLCDIIDNRLSNLYGINLINMSKYTKKYTEENPVKMGIPLPEGTSPEKFLQPLFFRLSFKKRGGILSCITLVFFDIAGEKCVDVDKMGQFGEFVAHSDGMIMLFSPEQIDSDTYIKIKNENDGTNTRMITDILSTIAQYYSRIGRNINNLPTAVCISKGDEIQDDVLGEDLKDVSVSNAGKLFNTGDFNRIYDKIEKYFKDKKLEIEVKMNEYSKFNYFILSALGAKPIETGEYYTTVNLDGIENKNKITVPTAPPNPKRLIEPVAWLLYNFGVIGMDGQIKSPTDWECERCHLKQISNSYVECPVCHWNRETGFWKCPDCGRPNKPERQVCPCKEKKRRFFSFGGHRG